MPFRPEPDHAHGTPPRTAILLVNLGTPDAPTPAAVRRYLKEFLWDRRVVEIPRVIWWMILHGIILPIRSSKSARKYASIWTKDGSPLKVWTEKQTKLLRGALGARGHDVSVAYAMRYGNPSIASVLDALKAEHCERILVLPLYPQYSATTTASSFDAVHAWCATIRNVPELRFVKHYHDDPGYIAALASRVTAFREREGRAVDGGSVLLMSFHGVPRRMLTLGDPYHCECQKTARLLAERLGLQPGEWAISFQSRFGKAEWLKPYTFATLVELARSGARRVQIFCPGFPADCLETLEEIAIEGRRIFMGAGGVDYCAIPCINDDPGWIAALATISERHLHGWIAPDIARDKGAETRDRALALGAAR